MSSRMSPFEPRYMQRDQETTEMTHMIHPEVGTGKASRDNLPSLPAEARGLAIPSRKREISIEEEKMEQRRAANRRSAYESRKRRKILIADLQKAVADLTKEKEDLERQNLTVRFLLESALAENRQLRFSVLQPNQQLGQAAGVAAQLNGASLGLPPHAMVSTQPLLVNPALMMPFGVSTSGLAIPTGQQVAQQIPQGQNPGLNTAIGNLSSSASTDAAIAQLLVNQRAAVTDSNTSDTT